MQLFSIVVVCITVNLQLQLLVVAFHVAWIVYNLLRGQTVPKKWRILAFVRKAIWVTTHHEHHNVINIRGGAGGPDVLTKFWKIQLHKVGDFPI
jgi:hypothetical protein